MIQHMQKGITSNLPIPSQKMHKKCIFLQKDKGPLRNCMGHVVPEEQFG